MAEEGRSASSVSRHALVVAVQCGDMDELPALREAADELVGTLLDAAVGDCKPGLPDGRAFLYGQIPAAEVTAEMRSAIELAGRRGATLIVALLGHGFLAGTDSTLYLMAWDSKEGVRRTGVDVGSLLTEAADNPAVAGVIGIVDTCNAVGAQPLASSLATGAREGQAQLSLLMASAVGQEAFDLNMARTLTRLLHEGLPNAGATVRLDDLIAPLRAAIPGQSLVSSSYDGDQLADRLWLARNRHASAAANIVESTGQAQLREALQLVYPGQAFGSAWTLSQLRGLETELRLLTPSPELTRAQRIVDSLIVAAHTTAFLRRGMTLSLTTQGLQQALAMLRITPGPILTGMASVHNEADAVLSVALNYPATDSSCRNQMARFIVYLVSSAGLDPGGLQLREWARSVDADVALNDALAFWQEHRATQRLRLIVSLHYALADDWPESLGAWLLCDDEFYEHCDFPCQPDQASAEDALTQAVDWGEKHALVLGTALRRIEVAVPTSKLLCWRPEEVADDDGPRLGVNYDVLTRWSRRLESGTYSRRINANAAKRLREIAVQTGIGYINWLAAEHVADPGRLREELRAGLYTRAIGLMEDPSNPSLLELLLMFTPIVLWPQAGSVRAGHRRRVDDCWKLLPTEFLTAYRARWRAEDPVDVIADLRAVWDDEEWIAFCRTMQTKSDL